MLINLGIITERLSNYGGSEIYILECIKRWQHTLDITLYAAEINTDLFKEFDIDSNRVKVKILPRIKNKKHRFDLLEDLIVKPRIWERYVGQHDLYFQYLFPAQLVKKSPAIWFAAEPLRMLYDLHHHEASDESRISFHIYPRMKYDRAIKSDLDTVLQIVQDLDCNAKIENLVTNSRMMEGYLESIYGRKADLVAYPGINLPEKISGPADNRTAIFVGRLWDHKRVDLIIDALSLVPGARLDIVGDGPEKKKLKQQINRLKLNNRVRFLGNLSNRDLDQAYRNVTCGIYTPVREPFGIMPLEAASYGLPVIVTPDGGYTEALDSSCAHIVPPEPKRIAEAMENLFSSHSLAKQMGNAARARSSKFTWDHTSDRLLEMFKANVARTARLSSQHGCRPLLGAHYYCWYQTEKNTRHWNEDVKFSSVTDCPIDGKYDSSNTDTLIRHLAIAEDAGLDYLVINLQLSSEGFDGFELLATEALFDLVESTDSTISLCFMITSDNADTKTIFRAIKYLDDNFVQRQAYLRIYTKPVMWFFISESFIGHFFHNFVSFSKATDHFYRIASAGFCYTKSLPRHYGQFFDGWSLYSPLQISSANTRKALWAASYQDFLEVSGPQSLGIVSICPGFDDSALANTQRETTPFRKISRRGGETYIEMQKTSFENNSNPDLVIITSFNEFHENTHIEPSQKHKDLYLKMTKEFSDKLKAGGEQDPREIWNSSKGLSTVAS